MKKVKVANMKSPAGNNIPNQFEIEVGGDIYFQSYKTIIAVKTSKGIILDKNYWDYSRTTSKYRNIFLGEKTYETAGKIKSGEYKLKDLN